MKKQIACLVLLWMAAAFCMGCIFTFSAQHATESLDTSNSVLDVIIPIIDKDFDTYSPEKQKTLIEDYSFLVRKTAHFSIYTLLGFLVSNAFAYQSAVFGTPSRKKGAVLSFLICSLYAVSDEIHQYFVPGRGCAVRDMLIDSAGAAVGILFSLALAALITKRRKA